MPREKLDKVNIVDCCGTCEHYDYSSLSNVKHCLISTNGIVYVHKLEKPCELYKEDKYRKNMLFKKQIENVRGR